MRLNFIKQNLNYVKQTLCPSNGCQRPPDCHRFGHRLVANDTTPVNTCVTNNDSKLLLFKFRHKLFNRFDNHISSQSMGTLSLERNYCSKPSPAATSSSSSGSESDDISDDDSDDLFHEPPKVRFGLMKVALVIILGTYAGALFAMFGANLLEEYEIFVKGDDEEDD